MPARQAESDVAGQAGAVCAEAAPARLSKIDRGPQTRVHIKKSGLAGGMLPERRHLATSAHALKKVGACIGAAWAGQSQPPLMVPKPDRTGQRAETNH